MNIFSSDGWFSRFFGTLGDIIIVNILFILCSIPIVTMGASMSAMYFTLLKKQRTGENGDVGCMINNYMPCTADEIIRNNEIYQARLQSEAK